MIKAGIVGATGYAGAELVRLLISHPDVEIVAISSVSFEGMAISDVYPAYKKMCDMVCTNQDTVVERSDVVFAALPHGLSQELCQQCVDNGKVFIDLGADFRLDDEDVYKEWYGCAFLNKDLQSQAVYGMPEFFRNEIKGSTIIANPGCYTTAVPMALAPAVIKGYVSVRGIIADCKSGTTGGGRQASQKTHFPELNESFSAYKVANHRHCPEMEQTLSRLSRLNDMDFLFPNSSIAELSAFGNLDTFYNIQGEDAGVTFVPHLLPINRGILATCYARLYPGVTEKMIRKAYEELYADEFFVRFLPEGRVADIKNVQYSNFVDVSVHVDERAGMLVAISAIDNMVKGAAGQAIQNMNIIFGLDETTGLLIVPPAF